MSWREDVFEVPGEGVVLRGIVTRADTVPCDYRDLEQADGAIILGTAALSFTV